MPWPPYNRNVDPDFGVADPHGISIAVKLFRILPCLERLHRGDFGDLYQGNIQ